MIDLTQQIKQKEKELEELRRELEKQVCTARIHTFVKSSGKIRVSFSKFDTNAVEILRRVPGRMYSGEDNIIDAVYLDDVLRSFEPLEAENRLIVNWDDKSKEEWTQWISQPDFRLSLKEKKSEVLIELGPKQIRQRAYLGSEIQSLQYNIGHQNFTFSVAEAFKFPTIVKNQYPNAKVEYSEELNKIIQEQVGKSALLSEVATAKNWPEIPNPFTGINPITNQVWDLKPHQRVAIKFSELLDDKALIAYDMGLGKTAIDIAIIELRGYKKVLIICPAKAKWNWRAEIKKFTGQDSRILSGEQPDDLAIDDIISNKYKYYIINYDILSRASITEEVDGKEEYLNKWAMVINLAKFEFFGVDESHRIKNTGSKRSKAVRAINMPHVTPLSGTFIVNRPGELFPNLQLVARDDFRDEGSFNARFMYSDGTAKNTKQLRELLGRYMIRRTWKDVYGEDLAPNRIQFTKDLSETARKHYEKILEGIYISLRRPDYRREVPSILAQLTRCNQICSADNCETSADLAIEALEETGKKVLIFSQYLESHAAIAEILGKSAIILNGRSADEERDTGEKAFQDPQSEIKFIISNLTEIFTWTEAHTVVFNDMWWTAKDHQQAEGRAFGRTNDPHSGNSYYIINEETTDEFRYGLLQRKLALFKEVIDGVANEQEEANSIAMALIEHLRNSL